MSCLILREVAAPFTPRTKTCPWGPRGYHPTDEDLSVGAPGGVGRGDLSAEASGYSISGFTKGVTPVGEPENGKGGL